MYLEVSWPVTLQCLKVIGLGIESQITSPPDNAPQSELQTEIKITIPVVADRDFA